MSVNNSFSQSVNNLVSSVNIALDSLVALNTTMTNQTDTVNVSYENIDPITGDSSIYTMQLPSYFYIINKLNTISNSVDIFTKGNGQIILNDGTYREVKTIPIPITPNKITSITTPTTFGTRTNWFFESMMFPQLIIKIDLKNKIEDTSDRIKVKRVIFDNFNEDETNWFKSNIIGKELTYYDLVTLLSKNQKSYWEDEDVIDLPINNVLYTGDFTITNSQFINGKTWYTVNTLMYGNTTDQIILKDKQLNKGDKISYGENCVYIIDDILVNENKIALIPYIGLDTPTVNNIFKIYNEPFSSKIANIAIGYNECNSVFIKAINENYNLLASEWCDAISFYSNDLVHEDYNNVNLLNYYTAYVSDFGKQLEGQAKERYIPAYFGVTPNAPALILDNFKVVQTNTHLNSTLSEQDIINLQNSIINTKSEIDSLRNTITSLYTNKANATSENERNSIQKTIELNTTELNNKSLKYKSDVETLNTIAKQNSEVLANPKYEINGFFDIPEGVYFNNDASTQKQEAIQFEIQYRKLSVDGNSSPLNTINVSNQTTGQNTIGTVTNWKSIISNVRQRVFNSETNTFEWSVENIQDGDVININQVEIPIEKGEKVEIRIRSYSEAGWPINPLKSEWSNTIIVPFPEKFSSVNQVSSILLNAQSDLNNLKLEETLNSNGVTKHLDDTVSNTNSVNGLYYKHISSNIAYDWKQKQQDGTSLNVTTIDLQSTLEDLSNKTFLTITNPTNSGSAIPTKTTTLQKILQALFNADPSTYNNI